MWYNSQDTFPTWTFVQGDIFDHQKNLHDKSFLDERNIPTIWEKVNTNEVKWLQISKTDRCLSAIYNINLASRIANKVYLSLWQKKITTFDQLFDFVNSLPFLQYIKVWQKIDISVATKDSILNSSKTIQSISQKAMIKSILPAGQDRREEDDREYHFEVFIFIQKDICQVFINTSGDSLHNRWYRKYTVEAPIKENVAAWLVLLSWRKFKENFYDPFCWSWTICIEAAMIARNMPPWINRKFAFQNFPDYDHPLFQSIKEKLLSKVYTDKKYQIFGSDIDIDSIQSAKQNAINAWVEDTITFTQQDFLSISELSWHILSNPPYGKRLQEFDLNQTYSHIDKLLSNETTTWWIISSYDWFQNIINPKTYSTKTIFNWSDKCIFWKKI